MKKNAEVDNTKAIDAVMGMYNLNEHGDCYSKTSGTLWYLIDDIRY